MSIQTEVKALSAHEHAVHVSVPEAEYQKAYAAQVNKLRGKIKLPGFRPGKAPMDVVEQKYGGQARQDTIEQLISDYYAEALESSGLTPAIQPQIEVPQDVEAPGLNFTMKVVTWPSVELGDLKKLEFDEMKVDVTDQDVEQALDHLLAEQVTYEEKSGYAAQQGDALQVDFTGFIGDQPFDGGRGENIRLELGEGRFIPGFEDGLIGAKAGDQRTVHATFPEDYNHETLAGMQARFEVLVRTVSQAKKAGNLDELASLLGFDSVDELQSDVRKRLSTEADNASRVLNREGVFNALLAAHDIPLPQALVHDATQKNIQRLAQQLQSQGTQLTSDMMADAAFQAEARSRSERELRLAILLHAIRQDGAISLDEDEVNARIVGMAERYPSKDREAFIRWFSQQEAQLNGLRDDVMQMQCVAYVLLHAKTKQVTMSLNAWREAQQAREEGGQLVTPEQEAA